MSDENRLLTPEEAGRQMAQIWNRSMGVYLEEKRRQGATEDEMLEIANDAIACAFGGIWVSPE